MVTAAVVSHERLNVFKKNFPKTIPRWKLSSTVEKTKENEDKSSPMLHASDGFDDLTFIRPREQTVSKKCSTSSKATKILAKSTPCKGNAELADPTQVKPAALLYEITERTNQLAQPRIRLSQTMDSIQPQLTVPRIPQATARVLELSKPRTILQEPQKPPGYVSPAALSATATQRIIELSRPKKKRKVETPKKKKFIYETCSPRIMYLSNPRQTEIWENKLQSFMPPTNEEFYQESEEEFENWFTPRDENQKSEGQKSFERLYSNRETKKKRMKKKKRRAIRSSNSDRTIITVNMNSQKDSHIQPKRLSKAKHRKPRRSKPIH